MQNSVENLKTGKTRFFEPKTMVRSRGERAMLGLGDIGHLIFLYLYYAARHDEILRNGMAVQIYFFRKYRSVWHSPYLFKSNPIFILKHI